MAVKLADALVYLATNSDKLKEGLGQAEQVTKSWTQNFAGMAKTALIGGVVTAGAAATTAVVAIGKAAFDVSSETRQAARDMAASLNLPIEEAEKFAEVAKRVYGNNFAESVGDAADAVENIAMTMGLAADDPALQTLTEHAFRLRDAFDVDVAESVSAAQTLVENFGVSGEEAFQLIAHGYQSGLDRSGDFLDTIGEYSTQFKEGGASAYEFFGFLETGLQGGMLGTDKAADAFKEFRLRIQDGSESTITALNAIGLNAEEMSAQMAAGTLDAATAFGMVRNALTEVDDQNLQMQAGVALMGSQFEDLGMQIVSGLRLTEPDFEKLDTSLTALSQQYGSFGGMASAVWRRIVVSATPVTDKILEMANNAMPAVMGAFDAFDAAMGPVIDTLTALASYIQAVVEDGDTLNDWLTHLPEPLQGVAQAIGNVITWFQGLGTSIDEDGSGRFQYFKDWIDQNMPRIQQIVETVINAISGFWQEHGDAIMYVVNNTITVAFTIIDTALKNLMDVISLALQLLTGDWEGAWETMKGMVERTWTTIQTVVGTQLDSVWRLITDFDWGELGRNIVEGIAAGLRNAGGIIADAARQAAQSAYDAARSWLGIHSPSTVFAYLGEQSGAGYGKGFVDSMSLEEQRMAAELDRITRDLAERQAQDAEAVLQQGLASLGGNVTQLGAPNVPGNVAPSSSARPENLPARLLDGLEDAARRVDRQLSMLLDAVETQTALAVEGARRPPLELTVYVSGADATYAAGRAVGRGVLDELRSRGLA